MTLPAVPGISIRTLDAAGLDHLAPLWTSLFEHHRSLAPELERVGVSVGPAESWRRRCGEYAAWLNEHGTVVLLAERRDRPVGYAVARQRPAPVGSWDFGARLGELETLVVHPAHRGQGIGTLLLAQVLDGFRQAGIGTWSVGVLAANHAAGRLYARFGQVPFLTTMVGRVPPAPA